MTVELTGADSEINSVLRERLSGAGIRLRGLESGVVFPIAGWADCERIGTLLSGFIADRSDSFEVRIDGPGGETLIHEVRVVGDPASLATFLATCAYLQ